MRFRTAMYAVVTPLAAMAVALPAVAASAHVAPKPTEIILKDGRGLDAQTRFVWQYNRALHRWVRVEALTGKVLVDRNQGEGYWGDRNQSEHFSLVYGPAGKMAFIRYDGPGAMHGWFVQTSDKRLGFGYLGSKLVKNALDATIFTVSNPGPLGFRTLTVPAKAGIGGHGPEILTGELFGQLGLNAQRPLALPTNAQLFIER